MLHILMMYAEIHRCSNIESKIKISLLRNGFVGFIADNIVFHIQGSRHRCEDWYIDDRSP